MIIREKEPANLEMPFGDLESFITPNDQFYVRSHFAALGRRPGARTFRVRSQGTARFAAQRCHQSAAPSRGR